MTHTDHTYDTKEQARQAMHRFLKGLIDDDKHQIGNVDGECHAVWSKTVRDGNGKLVKQNVQPTGDGRFMIRVES